MAITLLAFTLSAGACVPSPRDAPAPPPDENHHNSADRSASIGTGVLREAGVDTVAPTLRRPPPLRLDRPPTVRRHLWDREPVPADRPGEHRVKPHLWDRR